MERTSEHRGLLEKEDWVVGRAQGPHLSWGLCSSLLLLRGPEDSQKCELGGGLSSQHPKQPAKVTHPVPETYRVFSDADGGVRGRPGGEDKGGRPQRPQREHKHTLSAGLGEEGGWNQRINTACID